MTDNRRTPTTDLLASLGELVRSCRLGMGLTQEALARRAGMSLGDIVDVERGTKGLTIALLNEIVERGLELQLDVAFRRRGQLGDVERLPVDVQEIVDALLRESPHARARLIEALRRELAEIGR